MLVYLRPHFMQECGSNVCAKFLPNLGIRFAKEVNEGCALIVLYSLVSVQFPEGHGSSVVKTAEIISLNLCTYTGNVVSPHELCT